MKKKILIIIIVVAVLVILACIPVIYYLLNHSSVISEDKSSEAAGSAAFSELSEESGAADYETMEIDGTTYEYNDDLRNYLFLGVDKENLEETMTGHADAGQCDALFLISWNYKTGDVTMVAIPRDTITEITRYSYDGQSHERVQDHISLSYAYGDGQSGSCILASRAVSNLLGGIPITGYMALDMASLPVIMDTVGSFDVTIPNDSLTYKDASLTQGSVLTITVENVEDFVRSRDTDTDGSPVQRMERQEAFLQGLLEKMTANYQTDTTVTAKLFLNLGDYMVSNISEPLLNDLMEDLASAGISDQWTIPGISVTEEYDEYHVDEDALAVSIANTFYISK